ncbi:MAG: response regulator transcription factor [Bdellovibrionales bacterium]|nr:response regulator transcription factor [Bdellovibrionales bacterium]
MLVVEDEQDIQELITLHLRREGYQVEAVADGEEALKRLRRPLPGEALPYDVILLDWMLPGMSGLEITRALRASESGKIIPILMVTARMEAADIVLGLEAGADDYVTKPFEIPVLLARVRALIRRATITHALSQGETLGAGLGTKAGEAGLKTIQLGDLVIDPNAYEVRCGKEPLSLTPSEFKLLLALAQNQGRVLTRDQLIDAVQGIGVTVVDRAIDTHIFGLRKKLSNCSDWIETVRGIGYRIKLAP